jgi:GNAT superfamily N-acetyltransferase
MLLVRRVATDDVEPALGLLTAAGVSASEAHDLAALGGLTALGDVVQPADAPPIGVLALRIGLDGRAANVVAMIVAESMRRRGHARRLLIDTMTMLRSEGCRVIECSVDLGDPVDQLLRNIGFHPDSTSTASANATTASFTRLVLEL